MQEGYKKSDIEILVSTMNRNSLDFLKPMFPFAHYSDYKILVINQTTESNIIESPYSFVRVINSFEKGLSKSRNMALDNAVGKLCIITDDDVVFTEGFAENILNSFNENPEVSLIVFRVVKPDGSLFRKYPLGKKNAKRTLLLNILSIEIVLNKEFINSAEIKFNESFGLGARFFMGEESIFVNEVFDKKGKIIFIPKIIVSHPYEHTDNKLSIKDKYYVQGAFFTQVFKKGFYKWILIKILFDLKQKKINLSQISMAIKAAVKGNKDLIKMHGNNN